MLRAFHEQRIVDREKVSWEEGYKAFASELLRLATCCQLAQDLKSLPF